jgi:mono/diheme cytochrome c family protein
MYANGMRVEDYKLLQKDGMLKHATFSHPLTDEEKQGVSEKLFSKMQDGKDVFLISCSRCHTVKGPSSIIKKFDKLMNNGDWDEVNIANYIQTVHDIQQFMPPFPGTKTEAEAMTTYLVNIKKNNANISGAQSTGIKKR